MSDGVLILTVATALCCGLNAGVFFAFSSFVMRALWRLPAAHGVAAMQSINVVAVTFAFMVALFGTAAACVVVVVLAVFAWGEMYAVYQLAGGVLYLLGAIALTIAYHVPRNNALARVDPSSTEAATVWAAYVRSWTAWNHVRAAASLAAAALLVVAIRVG